MTQEEFTEVLEQSQPGPASKGEGAGQPSRAAPQTRALEAGDTASSSILQDLGELVPSAQNLEMLLDVNLRVTVELGRTSLKFRDILNLGAGAIVELNRQTSEPVDILVNGAPIATGEVVVVDDHFAIRIGKLLNRVERLKRVV